MEVNVRDINETIILDFSGVWESGDSAETKRSMTQLLDLGYKQIILNLSDISLLPRKGAPLLHSFCEEARKKGCQVKIVASSQQVRGTLRSGGFMGSIGLYRDETNALKEFD